MNRKKRAEPPGQIGLYQHVHHYCLYILRSNNPRALLKFVYFPSQILENQARGRQKEHSRPCYSLENFFSLILMSVYNGRNSDILSKSSLELAIFNCSNSFCKSLHFIFCNCIPCYLQWLSNRVLSCMQFQWCDSTFAPGETGNLHMHLRTLGWVSQ